LEKKKKIKFLKKGVKYFLKKIKIKKIFCGKKKKKKRDLNLCTLEIAKTIEFVKMGVT